MINPLESPEVRGIRLEAKQFAMLYFHFVKTLVDTLGEVKAETVVRKALFELALDRSGRMRKDAEKQGLAPTLESFDAVSDLPIAGWVPELGSKHCPYAERWTEYYGDYPWFQRFALLYCTVIDTTNIENFTGSLTHRLTKNVLQGDETCDRVYSPSEDVQNGVFTYAPKNESEPD